MKITLDAGARRLAIVIAALLLAVAAWYGWQYASGLVYGTVTEHAQPPKKEIAATDEATRKVTERVEVITHEVVKWKEETRDAKKDAADYVAGLSIDAVAARWNERLGRYRESSGDAQLEE